MADFKIVDSFEENDTTKSTNNKKNNSKTIAIIIVVVISLILGGLVYFTSNAIFNKKDKREENEEFKKLELNNETVSILYQYVTYGTRGQRNDKFINNLSVKLSDFTNKEKFYYALQFAKPEDFKFTKKIDENDRKVYLISTSTIDKYMKYFFGDSVTYTTDDEIIYPFGFSINGQNVGIMKYQRARKGFETIFYGVEEEIKNTDVVKPYYTKLSEAYENKDGTVVLKEKIIYTKVTPVANGLYNIEVYGDLQKSKLLERIDNMSLEQLKANPIIIDDYLEKAATIQYVFGLSLSNNYYFQSSTILG